MSPNIGRTEEDVRTITSVIIRPFYKTTSLFPDTLLHTIDPFLQHPTTSIHPAWQRTTRFSRELPHTYPRSWSDNSFKAVQPGHKETKDVQANPRITGEA